MTPETVLSLPEENTGHITRYYISESSDTYKYILPADEEEKERLNLQSQVINKMFDDKFIWAPVTLKADDVVLDSGTGSGHWLLTLAKVISPTVHLRGIDISPRMFPLPSSIPPNVTFTSLSITSLPESWNNTISLIHQRLLYVALQAEQWKAGVSEMYRVLIPGGWVQLFEPNHLCMSPSTAIREHKMFAIRDGLCCGVRRVAVDVVDHLQTWLEEAGFVNIRVEKRGLPIGSWAGEHGTLSLKSVLAGWNGIKGLVMREGGVGLVSSEEEYDAVVNDFAKLCEETPETYLEYWMFVARKPDT